MALWRIHSKRAIDRRVDSLGSASDSHETKIFESDSLSDLPDPVRTYFDSVIEDGRSYVSRARLTQEGEFLLGGATGSWKPMVATQYFSSDPPGFLWDAKIDVFPMVPARVVDAYENGKGTLEAKVLSVIPVANAGPNPEMNEGELLRYLAEAVWFPTALLPPEGVEWEPIDDRSAKATLEDGDNSATLVFHFDDDGLVERVHGDRYRQEEDSFAPWTGYFEGYEWQDGLRIPMSASVEWNLPDGPLPYWRARIDSVDFKY